MVKVELLNGSVDLLLWERKPFVSRSYGDITGRTISDLYKELENIGHENDLFQRVDDVQDLRNRECLRNETNEKEENQITVLQGCLKVVYVVGQLLGLYPITGFFDKDVMKIRFSFLTWKSFYSLIICSFQLTTVSICFYRFFVKPVRLSTIVFACYYTSNCMTSVFSLIVAKRWPGLMLELSQLRLDKYTDSRVKQKCTVISLVYLAISIVLQVLRGIGKLNEVMNCNATAKDMLKTYIQIASPWIFELNIPYNLFTVILVVILHIFTLMIWYFSDVFIICVSLFLASIVSKINEKVVSSENKIMPSTYWRSLREDYNRITTLIRSFDDVISGLIFLSFANSLFFICLQLYYILSKGVNTYFTVINGPCPNSIRGPFNGYEHSVYILSLISYLMLKFIFASLCISEINSASLKTAPSLYKIPSSIFCKEVQRFIDQLHGQIVALSGLNFFFVTRELIFSVFSTIITYELMLFQFSSEQFKLF